MRRAVGLCDHACALYLSPKEGGGGSQDYAGSKFGLFMLCHTTAIMSW